MNKYNLNSKTYYPYFESPVDINVTEIANKAVFD